MNHSIARKFTFSSLLLFTLPTMAMMVIMSLYTIVDGIFVSRFIGTNALSSTNIIYPVINVIIGFAIMLATGGNAIIARKMGEGKTQEARKIFSLIITAGLLSSMVLAIGGNLLIHPIVKFLGASDLLFNDCVTYLSILLWFSPAFMLQLLFQTFFVTEGRPGLGLILTIIAGIVNAVFDYILIVPMNMGIAGAAYATVMGYMIPAVAGLIYFSMSREVLFLVKPLKSFMILVYSCSNGVSEMVGSISAGIVTFLFNLLMMKYAGEDGVAAITIIQYSQFLLNALFIGFSQGVAPVFSYNYGSQNTAQLHRIFRYSVIFTILASIAALVVSWVFGNGIVAIFAVKGSSVYQLAAGGFHLFAISFLFAGSNLFSSALFTAFSDGRTSAIISIVRTFVLIILSLMIFPEAIGLTGIWIAVPAAEAGSILLSIHYILKYRNKYGYM